MGFFFFLCTISLNLHLYLRFPLTAKAFGVASKVNMDKFIKISVTQNKKNMTRKRHATSMIRWLPAIGVQGKILKGDVLLYFLPK